ncbi:MAG: DUF2062 domain-containing protein [Deltaproteobacteria bacterium]|nr:DUF2062 domain-containing protein [Deltaproteobacteria bacterium]
MDALKRRIKFFYDEFISLKGDPRRLALSMAVGVFIGATPTIPFHTAAIAALCVLFRQNFTAAVLGATIVSNPVTIPLLYLSQFYLGKSLTGYAAQANLNFADCSMISIFQMGWNIFVPLIVGGIIMAAAFAVPSYFVAYRAILAVRRRLRYEQPD